MSEPEEKPDQEELPGCDECALVADDPDWQTSMAAAGTPFGISAQEAMQRWLKVHHAAGHPTRAQRRALVMDWMAHATPEKREAMRHIAAEITRAQQHRTGS